MSSTVFLQDCNIGMKQYPDKYFDLAICDIPCGIGAGKMPFTRNITKSVKQRNGSKITVKKTQYQQSDWDSTPPDQSYFDELVRVSKNQIIFGIEYVTWLGVGPGRIKWDKCRPDGLSFKRYEIAYCSMIDYEYEIKLLHHGMMQAKSLLQPTVQQGNKKLNEKRIHPTQKPVLLYTKILQDFAKKEFKIIDTHLGSGTNRIACDLFGIQEFVAFENNDHIFNLSNKMWSKHKLQSRLNF